MSPKDRLVSRLAETRLEVAADRLEAVWAYFELLMKWNRRINLTGFSLEDDMVAAIDRLLVEPLAAATIARSAHAVLDVGSGGGSPAIPFFLGLKSASQLVLIESRTKKAVFLKEALRCAGVEGLVVAERFEQFVAPEPFDLITVRAVAPDHSLWSLVGRTLAPGGRLFWFHSVGQEQPQQDVVAWGQAMVLMEGDSRVSVGTALARPR